jgi:CubicO group peptidase (beta-lactamase class C family)
MTASNRTIIQRLTMMLISLLAPLAAACDGSDASTSDSRPASTAVSEAVPSAASTSEPFEMAHALRSAVEGSLDDFRGAVLVASGEGVLLSEGYGDADVEAGIPNDPTTRFRIGSVTKQFTGLAILILREQGLLDVTGSVCYYLTACPAVWQPITIENLVAHTSGIPEVTSLADYEATKAVPTMPDALVGRVRDLPLERVPGAGFSYSNSNYAVLGAVIENVSGMTYEDFLRTNIFEPLGMSDTGYETEGDGLAVGYSTADDEADVIDMSVPYAAGALSSTVGDLLRWNQAVASGTAAAGEATIDMLAPIENTTDHSGFGYGYGIYVSTNEDGPLAFHDGGIDGFSSVLVNDVGNNITVAILSNTNDSGDLTSAAWQLRAIVLAG